MGSDAVRVAFLSLAIAGLVLGGPANATGSEPVRVPIGAEPGTEVYSHPGESVVVERGDHLWKISSRHLGEMLGRTATNPETSPYWRSVIDINRGRLRSGDPDLIYPGEVIELPDPS